jgi:hypothetical protein
MLRLKGGDARQHGGRRCRGRRRRRSAARGRARAGGDAAVRDGGAGCRRREGSHGCARGDGDGSTSREDAGLGLHVGFIRMQWPGVWQVGMRQRIGLGLVLESKLPTAETRLG